jgi:hypothetical protein
VVRTSWKHRSRCQTHTLDSDLDTIVELLLGGHWDNLVVGCWKSESHGDVDDHLDACHGADETHICNCMAKSTCCGCGAASHRGIREASCTESSDDAVRERGLLLFKRMPLRSRTSRPILVMHVCDDLRLIGMLGML